MKIKPKDEDTIFAGTTLIRNLHRIVNKEYDDLVASLDIDEKTEEFLFDYVHNCDKDISFGEYLDLFNNEEPNEN